MILLISGAIDVAGLYPWHMAVENVCLNTLF